MEGFLKNAPSTEETIKGEKFKFEAEGQIHTVENVNKTTETTCRPSICIQTKTILITGMARPNADSAPHLILARAKTENSPECGRARECAFSSTHVGHAHSFCAPPRYGSEGRWARKDSEKLAFLCEER